MDVISLIDIRVVAFFVVEVYENLDDFDRAEMEEVKAAAVRLLGRVGQSDSL